MNARRNRPLIVWMAMLAVLVGTLAPSFTAMLASWTGQYPLEVCTTPSYPGSPGHHRLLPTYGTDVPTPRPLDHSTLHGDGHCPYCRLQQDMPMVASVPPALVLSVRIASRVTQLLAPTPPPALALWRPHLGRAPPRIA